MAQFEEGRFPSVPRREKWLRGFLVFYVYLFASVGSCTSQDLHRFVKLSYDVVWVGVDLYGFKMDWVPAPACRSPKVLSTDCFWQNTAGASAQTPKEQRAPQICLKPWASRHSWTSYFFPTVIRSQQQRGKKFVVPSGSIWRRQTSARASQREMVEGFLVFYVYLFVSVGSCTS